ncbi:MAG: divergent PAP2 family protein, partial [Nanoarchaeota archaeon]|nr:divergent PAP2 family protein [Nanoarchaeota archaeon]
ISIVLALIVIRDAIGVRRTVGEEGEIIKELLKKHRIKHSFHNSIGHTPLQVIIGSILGFLIALLVHFF